MAYPGNIEQFTNKLNKKPDGSNHVIEERFPVSEGKYDGPLSHDDILNNTIRVYTGTMFSGDAVTNFVVSVPAETPWRRNIKIFSDSPDVYVTYETPGDRVEADDVNVLQDAITAAQTELERYKVEGTVDGGSFYEGE